jgi:hypothetical protein
MAGRAGYPSPRDQGKDYIHALFTAIDLVPHPGRRLEQKVLDKKFTGHGGMTAPADKRNVSPEPHVAPALHRRVGDHLVAEKTDRLAIDLDLFALVVEHGMRIDVGILILCMALET